MLITQITIPTPWRSLSDVGNTISTKLLPLVYSIVGVVLLGMFIAGGFTWLTSAGDPDKLKKAQQSMLNAVIGAVIVVFAYVATRVIAGILNVDLI